MLKKYCIMIHSVFCTFQLMICNGCLLNLEIICLKYGNKKMPYFFSKVFINWNDIIGWINIYDLLVQLSFV
jgi:hypothetical protein